MSKSLVAKIIHVLLEDSDAFSVIRREIDLPREPSAALNVENGFSHKKCFERYADIMIVLQENRWLLSKNDLLLSLDLDGVEELISVMSQWDELLKIWDRLAEFSRKNEFYVDPKLLDILQISLSLVNKRFDSPPLHLVIPESGQRIDPKLFNRANITGDIVERTVLPAIYGIDGKPVRAALVISK